MYYLGKRFLFCFLCCCWVFFILLYAFSTNIYPCIPSSISPHPPPSPPIPPPPSVSVPCPLLSVSSVPITSPETNTPFLHYPQSQLWSPARSAQGKMDRGQACGKREGRSAVRPEINKPSDRAAESEGPDARGEEWGAGPTYQSPLMGNG